MTITKDADNNENSESNDCIQLCLLVYNCLSVAPLTEAQSKWSEVALIGNYPVLFTDPWLQHFNHVPSSIQPLTHTHTHWHTHTHTLSVSVCESLMHSWCLQERKGEISTKEKTPLLGQGISGTSVISRIIFSLLACLPFLTKNCLHDRHILAGKNNGFLQVHKYNSSPKHQNTSNINALSLLQPSNELSQQSAAHRCKWEFRKEQDDVSTCPCLSC